MSYTRVNWENSPSTNTPLNATNLNKMDKGIKDLDDNKANKDDNLLIFRGNIPSTNLNEIQTTGIYYIAGQSLTNAPSTSSYSILIVIATSLIHQYIFKPVGNVIYMREYSGSPGQWYSWQTK